MFFFFAFSLSSSLGKEWGPSFEPIWSPFTKNALCQVWLFCYYLPLKKDVRGPSFVKFLIPLYPKMLCIKFGWNWPCGFWEEEENVESLRQRRRQQRRRTTDKLLLENLTSAFGSGELIKTSLLPVKLKNIRVYSALTGIWPLNMEESVVCHTCCDTGPRFKRFHSKKCQLIVFYDKQLYDVILCSFKNYIIFLFGVTTMLSETFINHYLGWWCDLHFPGKAT